MNPSSRSFLPRIRQIAVNTVLVGGSLVAGLLLLEIVLRAAYPQGDRHGLHEFEPDLGHLTKKNLDRTYVWDGHEAVTRIQTNSLGLRNAEIPARKSPDEFRILLLGDSYTFGYGVEGDETFGRALERRLNRQPGHAGRRFAVINAGVIGYGTANQLRLYERLGGRFDADLVILNMTLGNDIQDNLCRVYGSDIPVLSCPLFAVDNGRLVEKRLPVRVSPSADRDWKQTLEDSELGRLLAVRGVGFLGAVPSFVRLAESLGVRIRPRSLPTVVEGWYSPSCWPHGWLLTQKLIDRLREDVADNARLAVVLIPSRLQVLPQLKEVSSVLYDGRAEVAEFSGDPLRPQRLLTDYLGAGGVPTLDLQPMLEREPSLQRLYYPLTQHWTPAGHEVVADALQRFLLSNALVSPGAAARARAARAH